MVTLGEQLRREREARGIPLSEVAAATKIGRHHLEAIEEDAFEKLPGDVFTRGYVRAYATHLGLDGLAAVEEFRRQRSREDETDTNEAASVVPEMARLLGADRERADRTRHLHRVLVLACGGMLAAGGGAALWLATSRSGTPIAVASRKPTVEAAPARLERPPEAPAPRAPAATTPTHLESVARLNVPPPEPQPEASPSAPPAPAGESTLAITRHGVGDGIRDRELTGESDRFPEGSVVWFWNLVEGSGGASIEHVWLHADREVHRITLPLGSSRWRTQSRKTIRGCDDASWAVEARDAGGRVLARSTFTCTR